MKWTLLAFLVAFVGCSKSVPPGASPPAEEPHPQAAAQSAPTESELGVPFYPSATAAGGKISSDLTDAQFLTKDSVDKVASFYLGNVSGATATGDKNETLIEFTKNGRVYSIELHRSRSEGMTLISISSRH